MSASPAIIPLEQGWNDEIKVYNPLPLYRVTRSAYDFQGGDHCT
jgi:hypothetical protein